MSEKVKVKLELEDRYWAEPVIVSLYLYDKKGVFEVWRWYVTDDSVLECNETVQELDCQGFLAEDAYNEVLRAIREILEANEAKLEKEDVYAEIETNSERMKEKIAAIVSKLSI